MSRRTLILGANSAITVGVATLCAARGGRLYLVGRDPAKLHTLVAALGPVPRPMPCTSNTRSVIDGRLGIPKLA